MPRFAEPSTPVRASRLCRPVLQVHPIAIGAGKPLFTQKTELHLISAKTYDSGVMRLRYQTRRDPPAHHSGGNKDL